MYIFFFNMFFYDKGSLHGYNTCICSSYSKRLNNSNIHFANTCILFTRQNCIALNCSYAMIIPNEIIVTYRIVGLSKCIENSKEVKKLVLFFFVNFRYA